VVTRTTRARMLGGARLVTVAMVLAGAAAVAGGPALRGRDDTSVRGLHDISTDLDDPPPFIDVRSRRRWAFNPPEYAGPAAAALQRRGYPDIQPLFTTRDPATVFTIVRALVAARGWDVAADVPADGRLEAVALTPWLRFRDDVVVRVRATADGTRVDVRSKSRVGRSDFGANARRVRAFLADLETRLSQESSS